MVQGIPGPNIIPGARALDTDWTWGRPRVFRKFTRRAAAIWNVRSPWAPLKNMDQRKVASFVAKELKAAVEDSDGWASHTQASHTWASHSTLGITLGITPTHLGITPNLGWAVTSRVLKLEQGLMRWRSPAGVSDK